MPSVTAGYIDFREIFVFVCDSFASVQDFFADPIRLLWLASHQNSSLE